MSSLPPFANMPLSLYIHIPWCVRKCPYCDFNSHAVQDEGIPEAAYVQALLADLDSQLPHIWGRSIHSIFIGGGTPSLFSPDSIQTLLSGLRARLNLQPQIEITLEANPGTVDKARFAGFRQAGINRLSIGIQSLKDEALRALGRIHNRQQAIAAVEAAVHAGFERINLDLMFGLPQQSVDSALEDLQTGLALQPTHLSWYQLTLEPNTLFYRHPPPLPDDDRLWDMQIQGQTLLAKQGYEQYEVSAYARPGHRCQHNLNYWLFGDYVALGAGAHGKISHVQQQAVRRYSKLRHPRAYLEAPHHEQIAHELTAEDLRIEFMLNALRLPEGFERTLWTERTGLEWSAIEERMQAAIVQGWLVLSPTHIRPTAEGLRFLDEILMLF